MSNYARYFERRTRDNGEAFYTVSDDCPDWLHDAVRDAHDGELPNDWRFEHCARIVDMLDDGEDDASSIADSLMDVYTSELFQWLSDQPSRRDYCDDAVSEGLTDGSELERTITVGQYVCIEQMAQILIDAIEANEEEES